MELLKGEHIYLRALEPEDVNILFALENDSTAWEEGCNIQPYSMHTLRQYIECQTDDIYTNKQLRLVVCEKEKQKPIGLIDLYDYEPRHNHAWVGIIISKEERGKGSGTEALSLLSEYAFKFLHLHQLLSDVCIDNKASLKLFEKDGYVKCGLMKDYLNGKDGYKDVAVMQKISK